MEIVLRDKEMLAFPGNRRGVRCSCEAGDLWMTQEGDSRDHLLRPGQIYETRLRGEIVLTALADSRLCLQSADCGRPPRARNWMPAVSAGRAKTLQEVDGLSGMQRKAGWLSSDFSSFERA
jgi:hypothetical protein